MPSKSDRTLATIADQYNLERYLRMGAAARANPVGRETRLADALEAMVAAFYLSTQDLSLIRPWLDRHFRAIAADIAQDPTRQNHRGALQEITQSRYRALPEYRVTEVGQDYGDPERFIAEVWIQNQCVGIGKGPVQKSGGASRCSASLPQAEQTPSALAGSV